jgi:hypothetical protein
MTRERKVIRTDTTKVDSAGETSPFGPDQARPAADRHAAETEFVAPPSSYVPPPRRPAASESGRTTISELRDLCEAALLTPQPSATTDPLAALELRAGKEPSPREPGTAARIADELVRRIKKMPQLRARIVAQLISGGEPLPTLAEVGGSDNHSALKELRAVRNLLDNLGCPRSEDDRNLSVVERIRWLLDVLTASHRAADANQGTRRYQLGDNTPATGAQKVIDPGDMR